MDLNKSPVSHGIVDRAKAIVMKPKEEWPRIAIDPQSSGDILTRYALPLILIGPVCAFIGGQLFGYGAFGFSYRPAIMDGVGTLVFSLVMAVIQLIALTLIADFLAPRFGGQSNRAQAFKLVAYSMTAAWLVGVFGLVPSLAFLGLLGIYSFYLFYLGATPVMHVPADKAAGYTVVTAVCAIVLFLIIGAISSSAMGLFGPTVVTSNAVANNAAASNAAASNTAIDGGGSITTPGGSTIDLAKVNAASAQMEAAANGKAPPPVAPARLQELLPAAIGSFPRTAVESMAMGAMGSTAEGTYGAGDTSFKLKVVDMSAMGAIAGLGAAMGVEQNREDADGYEKTATVDGQMRSESWRKSDSSGKYGVIVANRFSIEAEGHAGSIDDLKAAVATVNQSDRTGLATGG